MSIDVVSPATEEIISSYDELSPDEVDTIIRKNKTAQEEWESVGFPQRADVLRTLSESLKNHRRDYARLMAREMGKPLSQGETEIDKCAWVCDYYAEHGALFLADDPRASDASRSYVTYRPLGPILAIMPWNFPFWQVFRFLAPALMAGNSALLKHASNVPGCAKAIEDLFVDLQVPDYLFRTLLIESGRVGRVIEHPDVAAVTLTGSTRAGRQVASRAGATVKKTVLELGGSDPYLILEDADLESAVEKCVTSRLLNSGQSCIAAKRFVAVKSIREQFEARVIDAMHQKTMGDPLREDPDIGPLARVDLRDELHNQVRRSIKAGAHRALGGEVPNRTGAYYPPTVLTDVTPNMPAYESELFGPVASIISVENEEEAIRVANDTSYGLGAAVFTEDVERGETIAAKHLDAGCCFVNNYVRSDPRLPFGGIKASGYGRELSREGLREFVNAKTVSVA